ncbi:MAG: DUF1330 domain-containing protein [Woeseiaceae bacterium]
MRTIKTVSTYLAILMAMALALPAAMAGEKSTSAAAPPDPLTLDLREGQLLSVISVLPKAGPEAAAARQSYAENAFGIAKAFGMRSMGGLPVVEVVSGEFAPRAVVFYAWPNADAEQQFSTDPSWQPIKATRPEGWSELRFHDVMIPQDVTLRFQQDKTYTMASAWINPDRPNDYDQYLANINKAVNAVGGRFIYRIVEPDFVSLSENLQAPGRLVFVEWDSRSSLDDFLKTTVFKENAALMQSGITNFELVVLSTGRESASSN